MILDAKKSLCKAVTEFPDVLVQHFTAGNKPSEAIRKIISNSARKVLGPFTHKLEKKSGV